MDHIWIGDLKANSVSGTVNVGPFVQVGTSSSAKSNTGNGSINGDYSAMPLLWSMVDDRDQYDSNQRNHFGPTLFEPQSALEGG